MEHCCKLVEWPIILRTERLSGSALARASAYQAREARGYLRCARALSLNLLRQGEVLVIFPEAYPLIDPHPGPRGAHQTFLPFQPGFAHLLELAERDGETRVALIPAGLAYTRQGSTWRLLLRFGPALFRQDFPTRAQFMTAVEQRVQTLSAPEASAPPCPTSLSIS
jgi:hypothetical protein